MSSPQTTIYSTTYFDCNSGFETNGASQPFYTCEPNTYLAGLWTPVSYSFEKSSDCCDPTTAPLLSNAVSNTPQTTINSVTYFSCNMGMKLFRIVTKFYFVLEFVKFHKLSDTFDERNTNRLSSNLESTHLVKKIQFHQAKEVLKTIMQHSKNAL